MDFLLIVFLTLLNGVFSMSELALASSRKARLNAMAEEGDKGSRAALDLLTNPTQFLSSVQVGITSIGMLNGIIGEAAFSGGVSVWLQSLGVSVRAADISATAIVVAVITYVTIVFGELVPKRIGQLYPETVARLVSRPMMRVAAGAKPFVWLLSVSTQAVLKLLRVDNSAGRAVTEEEIAASLVEGVDAGLIEAHEHQMVQNVFLLDDRLLTSLMLPRGSIEWLDASATLAQAIDKASVTGHSWYPVCRGSLDDVVGVVNVAKLLALRGPIQLASSNEASGSVPTVADRIGLYAVPAVFVPETLTGMELLEQFRARSTRIVLVVDEYGVVQGLMTPMDMLEAITGELQTGTTQDAWATRREDGSWLIDGLMPVSELKARLDIRDLPEEDRGRYNTVAGLLQSVSGHLPSTGERIACAGWQFEIVDLDGKRIDKVLVTATS
ncbi:Hemolysins and related proteins containing CBS domains [Polaromonas sp. CG9_12]|uniref:hemolysin family protein n=1 Tax=Polaromonas sp. CG_9.11 TaxID=2787730 RepID=UPI0004DDDAAF|nr:hemolysin family protein [Polaromonas sp. CG_9.11]MBG6076386.1 putative hemolysin [Polaromonas sp. CG_9.11]CDS50547.1 Hemolysins and related proteins containing CBS domains [Polaromonas sp. CG9_12]